MHVTDNRVDCWAGTQVPDTLLETAAKMKEAVARLKRSVERAGRDPRELEIAYRVPSFQLTKTSGPRTGRPAFTGTADQIAGDVREFEAAGVGTLILNFPTDAVGSLLEPMEQFAKEVMARVQGSTLLR